MRSSVIEHGRAISCNLAVLPEKKADVHLLMEEKP